MSKRKRKTQQKSADDHASKKFMSTWTNPHTEVVTLARSADVSYAKSDDVLCAKSDDVSYAKSDDVSYAKSDDVSCAKSDDVSYAKSDDVLCANLVDEKGVHVQLTIESQTTAEHEQKAEIKFFDDPLPSQSSCQLSDEQEEIARCVLDLKNVRVIAKAGSGKTTTSIEISKRFYEKFNKRTLILTYNSRLKTETREKIVKLGMKHAVECHSYHAAACKFFSYTEFEPQEIDNGILYNAMRHKAQKSLDFGLLIIDESQDMNDLYAKFVIHMLKQFPEKPLLMMLGDPFQRIFGFNGADSNYLLEPDKYFAPFIFPSPFITRHMTICWRITHEMAVFINTKMNPNNLQYTYPEWWKQHGQVISALWGEGIRANPKRPPCPGSVVYYKVKNAYNDKRYIEEAKLLFDTFGNNEVAVLGYSLKAKTPMQICVDKLGKHIHENWVVLTDESEFKNEDTIMNNKRVASTIHKFKGLERKGIMVIGMNEFIESISKTSPLDHFNLYYVACTRAKEKIVIQGSGKEYATIRSREISFEQKSRPCFVTDLTRHVPFDTILNSRDTLFKTKLLTESEFAFDLKTDDRIIDGRVAGTLEDLSPFIGTAVHSKLRDLIHPDSLFPITQFIDQNLLDSDMVEWEKTIFETKKSSQFTWEDFTRYAIVVETTFSKYKHYWRQITPNVHKIKHALLDRALLNTVTSIYTTVRMYRHEEKESTPPSLDDMILYLRPLSRCEIPVKVGIPFNWFSEYENSISGSIDLVVTISPTKKLIIELKVSNGLKLDHMLQVQMYTQMYKYTIDQKSELIPIVVLANRGEAHELTIDPAIEPEFVYRMALRKTGQKFEPRLIKTIS
jgi:hypothetical protein